MKAIIKKDAVFIDVKHNIGRKFYEMGTGNTFNEDELLFVQQTASNDRELFRFELIKAILLNLVQRKDYADITYEASARCAILQADELIKQLDL